MNEMEKILGRVRLWNVNGDIKSDIGSLVRVIALKKWRTKAFPCHRLYYVACLDKLINEP